jgi:hypothetical protein
MAAQPQAASRPEVPSAVQPQSPLDQSRLESTASIDPPSEQSEPRGAIHEPQQESVDTPSANSNTENSNTANTNAGNISTSSSNSKTAWNVAVLPKQITETAASSEPELNPQNPSNAIWVQARLADLGYFTGSRSGVWGPATRSALRDFKSMNGLQEDDQWDKETEQRLSSRLVIPAAKTFIGGWAEDSDQCRTGAVLSINSRAAKSTGAECDFRSVKRETAARWHVEAVCTDGGRPWTANVNLKLNTPKLTWSSERGTATYVRCAKPPTSLGERSASLGERSASLGERSASVGDRGTFVQDFEDWLQGVRKLVFVHE